MAYQADTDFANQVKQHFLVQEVIPQHVQLKRVGGNLVGQCPFCQSKKGFNVHPPKSMWKCFGCAKGGDVIQFLMDFQDRKFVEVIEDLARQAGIPVPETVSWRQAKKDAEKRRKLKAEEKRNPRPNKGEPAKSSSPDASTLDQPGDATGNFDAATGSPSQDVAGEAPPISNAEIDRMAAESDGAHVDLGGGVSVTVGETKEATDETKDSHPVTGDAAQNEAEEGAPQADGGTANPEGDDASDAKGKIVPLPGAEKSAENAQKKKSKIRALPPLPEAEWPRPLQLLDEFYSELRLDEGDEESLWKKRGLEAGTSDLLGFRSNTKENASVLVRVADGYSNRDRIASGLFYRNPQGGPPVRVKQFYGWGLKGRRVVDGEKKEDWDWTYPVLIPYFDGGGNLIGIRPHKGGGRRSRFVRPRLYVPRVRERGTTRTFKTVVITESEFKCAALWQMIGEGSQLPEEDMLGVCGLPGIQQFQNVWMESDIRNFLNEVQPYRVVVVFDSEDKSNPNLPGYNPLFERRYDSLVYASVLAKKIGQWFPAIDSQVGQLPESWRDDSGKADWDGCLEGMVSERIELVS